MWVDWPGTMTSLFVILFYPVATLLLAPRSIRYFSKWKDSGQKTHLMASTMYGITAILLLVAIFAASLKPFIESKIL